MTYEVQVVTVERKPLMPGDVFKDGDNIIWMRMNGEREMALLLWHAYDAKRSREGDDVVSLDAIPFPFTLITELTKVNR